VQLTGEAFFSIKPDKTKPFVIQAGAVQISVVGTSFNVRNTDSLTEVIVETGRVEVKDGSDVYVLNPGDKLTLGAQLAKKERQSDRLYNYYRSNEFVCDNTPLWKLVAALNQAYQSDIVIDRPALRETHLTATFSGESLDRILEIIALTLDVKVVRGHDSIHLR
jgi:ferric-dicitrate binding protein FerR (iron transport regulator)